MVYKGLVMEVTKQYIIVFTDSSEYIKLKNKRNIDIGKHIMFIEEDIIKEKNKFFRPLIGIAAAIILVITTIIGQFTFDSKGNFKTYAIVSLDINPSLEFQIDKKKIVKNVEALNKDGQELIDNNVIGMKIEDAVILSIKIAVDKKYLNDEDNMVLVSDVIMDNKEDISDAIEEKIFEKLEEYEDLESIDIVYIGSNKENLDKAREKKVSIGKYKVYDMILSNNPDIKIEDIKNKKVSEILKENNELLKEQKIKTRKKVKDKVEIDVKDDNEDKEKGLENKIQIKDNSKKSSSKKNENNKKTATNKSKKNKEENYEKKENDVVNEVVEDTEDKNNDINIKNKESTEKKENKETKEENEKDNLKENTKNNKKGNKESKEKEKNNNDNKNNKKNNKNS